MDESRFSTEDVVWGGIGANGGWISGREDRGDAVRVEGGGNVMRQWYELVKGPHIYLRALLRRLRRIIQPVLVPIFRKAGDQR